MPVLNIVKTSEVLFCTENSTSLFPLQIRHRLANSFEKKCSGLPQITEDEFQYFTNMEKKATPCNVWDSYFHFRCKNDISILEALNSVNLENRWFLTKTSVFFSDFRKCILWEIPKTCMFRRFVKNTNSNCLCRRQKCTKFD